MEIRSKSRGLRMFIGDKAFYRAAVAIVLPIIIQNTVSNVVNLLDNVMVGQVGELEMSAVAIVNQLMFVFNLCIFGGLAGPGIFATQYVGAGDVNGVRSCFRLKLELGFVMSCIAIGVFTLMPDTLIRIFLQESGEEGKVVLACAREYLGVMVLGLLPFAVTCSYAMSLRENNETRLPMIASIAAILVNLLFNWLLIFGSCGFPKLGVKGAAIATVLSRLVEMSILIVAAHRRSDRFTFLRGAYRSLRVPVSLLKKVALKGSPLLFNEFLWSSGMAAIVACYSSRGIDAIAATNIASTINNLFNVVFLSMGNAVSIMVGQALGADDREGAKSLAWKLMGTTFMASVVMGGLMMLLAPFIPQVYEVEQSTRDTACQLLMVLAAFMPIFSIGHCCYFTLRAGGKTMITFFFDCAFTWCFSFACAWLLSSCTEMGLLGIYICVQSLDILKDIVGIILVRSGIWIHNIVS